MRKPRAYKGLRIVHCWNLFLDAAFFCKSIFDKTSVQLQGECKYILFKTFVF